jgi:hypothetical protein
MLHVAVDGRSTAQQVSRQLPMAVSGLGPSSGHVRWGDQSGTKAGFLTVLCFRMQIIIPPNAPRSLIILPSKKLQSQ